MKPNKRRVSKPQVWGCVSTERAYIGGNNTAWSFRGELLRKNHKHWDQHALRYLTSLLCDLLTTQWHLSIIVSNRWHKDTQYAWCNAQNLNVKSTHFPCNTSLFYLGRSRRKLCRLILPPRVPTSPGNFVIPFVPSVYTHPCLLYIMVPALRGSRHLLIQNLEEIPTNPQGSRSVAP